MATDNTKPPLIITIDNTGTPQSADNHAQSVADRLLANPVTMALEKIGGNAWIVFLASAGLVLLFTTLARRV